MKVRERQYIDGGMGGGGWFVRVVEVGGKTVPPGAVKVPDETPLSDWRHELPEEAPVGE